ncbi:MAG: ribonuclease P protein component [Clostridiales bacterium]|nr:ribonuclease P protein component [Clostridiales bacterium]
MGGEDMLSKQNRLTKRGSFAYVYRKGASRPDGALRITYVAGKGAPRIGISVPNTVGKAVVRNKVRRRIRAAMRGFVPHMRSAQMVVSAKKGAETLSYAQICETLRRLLYRSGLYDQKENNAVAHN